MTSENAIKFLESLKIPEGPLAGKPIRLADFQKRFIRGALADGVSIAGLSVGRGAGKTMLGSGLALAALLGKIDKQPRREVIVAAKTRDQGRIAWAFIEGLATSLPTKVRKQLTFVRSPRLEVRYEGDGGGHVLRVLASDAKNALGLAPVFSLLDERGFWDRDKGDSLEAAIFSALGKRSGRALVISTSAPDNTHSFSKMLDEPGERMYVQEHRAPEGCAPDDIEALKIANPGAASGIGSSLDWLQGEARRAMQRGGSTLSNFRLFNLNQRVSGENRDVLLTTDEWLACETADVPARGGQCIVGIDLGGSASMTAAAFFWPETGRLEALGWFPSQPSLLDRGQRDGVGDRYSQMSSRNELSTLGAMTVPVAPWLSEVMRHVEGETIAALVMDRFKQAELAQAIDAAGIRVPLVWRGMGFKDGNEDCDRFRRACFDGLVKAAPSLLLRSAMADTVCLRDPANNIKLAKARSLGRIDAACASVLAVAQGARMLAAPVRKARAPKWV
ncbi:Phage terminase-like protein, large subunit, contains N-terminal HTH domain [Bradyrhizobium sp. Rc2d]|uniref:terminase TerL endonuclease subunit n=1 Tax=Bradyrhizobium sp. Rc2d TaxID=1855321 RepID=UPI0008907D5D|nr:terminase TerL endonuclease subunit [Bradyrhizobium sp. Rc2d]SDJ34111.1 Phage terminase-like protein, large subunit, contains N-terminal HTH domain [Bradyrhizobium sp. Rc2d]